MPHVFIDSTGSDCTSRQSFKTKASWNDCLFAIIAICFSKTPGEVKQATFFPWCVPSEKFKNKMHRLLPSLSVCTSVAKEKHQYRCIVSDSICY